MTAPLPRSLSPLPDESLPGYLLRLAHRLGLSPAQLAHLTGLTATSQGVRAGAMLALPPATVARFAGATRLTLAEVTGLTLGPLSCRYPPLAPFFAGRQRQGSSLLVREMWVFSRFTRYCPQCLAGDGSLIQQRHGGGWNKLWRLPVIFACPTHRRLLEHACPGCHTPALARSGKAQALLTRGGDRTRHPATCRGNPEHSPRTDACQQRLDQTPPIDHELSLAALLALQDRLLDLLLPGGATSTTSVGQPTASARYFVDLRILTCLITASWPASEPLVRDHRHAALVDNHVDQLRRQIAHEERQRSRVRHNAIYDTPPANAATGAVLLAAAEAITQAGDLDAVRDIVGPMFQAHRRSRQWVRQFLPGGGYCSSGLQTAIGHEVRSRHILQRAGTLHHTAACWPLPPPQPVRYQIGHVPQQPHQKWIQTFLSGFTDLRPALLAEVVAIRLAHTSLGTTISEAAARLGIPQPAAADAFKHIDRRLAGSDRQAAFDHAIHDLAEHLNSAAGRGELTDYGRRRHALAGWRLGWQQWRTLVADMHTQPITGTGPTLPAGWTSGKRILATVWLWTNLTHGTYRYAPAINPEPRANGHNGNPVEFVHTRWHNLDNPTSGHYALLRRHLEDLAEHLAADLDNS